MHRAMGYAGLWNIDVNRFTREQMPPHVYLASSYYEKWAISLESLCIKYGIIETDEIAAGRALHPGKAAPRVLAAADVPKALTRRSFERPAPRPAKFSAGDRVLTKNMHPAGHTRLPRYARGKSGVIESVRGCHVFPDSLTVGKGEDPHWLYTVVFAARELWGESGDPASMVSIDAWEPYLDALPPSGARDNS